MSGETWARTIAGIAVAYVAIALFIPFDDFKGRDWLFLIGVAVANGLTVVNFVESRVSSRMNRNAAEAVETFNMVVAQPMLARIHETQSLPARIRGHVDTATDPTERHEFLASLQSDDVRPVLLQLRTCIRSMPNEYEDLKQRCHHVWSENYDAILDHFNTLMDLEAEASAVASSTAAIEAAIEELAKDVSAAIVAKKKQFHG